MARLTPGPAQTLTIDGEGREFHLLGSFDDVQFTVNYISLRRELPQNQVKVRPTNSTAVLVVEYVSNTVDNVYDEIIVLHNGPQGGFTQLPLIIDARDANIPADYQSINLYCNGVVAVAQTNTATPTP